MRSRCLASWVWVGALCSAACGGDTKENAFTEGGGSGGQAGSAGEGGASGGSSPEGGSGGMANGGVSSGGGGNSSAGAGGSGGAASGGCAPPANVSETAICLTLVPEQVTFEADPKFDGSGILLVEMFDRPDPPSGTGSLALYSQVIPADAAMGGEVSLSALPSPRITRENMPATVYFRVIFFDNPDSFGGEGLTPGAWVGGMDFSSGLREGLTLTPVALSGSSNAVSVPLVPIRQLTVTVDASATPAGDGEGPLVLLVTTSQNPGDNAPAFGTGAIPCADVADMPFDFAIPLIGPPGTYYVTGILNDLGGQGDFPPGVLAALDVDLQAQTATIPATLQLAQADYTPSISIDLSFVNPWPADAGAAPPNSCADILGGDGGAP
jgi:hypothetical protein